MAGWRPERRSGSHALTRAWLSLAGSSKSRPSPQSSASTRSGRISGGRSPRSWAGWWSPRITALALKRFYDSLGVVGTARTVWAVVLGGACGGGHRGAGRLRLDGGRPVAPGRHGSPTRIAWPPARRERRPPTGRGTWPGSASPRWCWRSWPSSCRRTTGRCADQYLDWDAIDAFLPSLWKGLWLNIKVFVVAEILVLVWGLVLAFARIFPGKAGRPVRFLAVVLHRPVPRLPRHHHDLPHRARVPGRRRPAVRPAAGRDQALLAEHDRARARLRRLRRRGLPGRPREHPLEPDRRGPLARPLLRPDHALRHHPAGGAPDHPAVAQRLHRPAEGHRVAERDRPARGPQPCPADVEPSCSTCRPTWPRASRSC